MLNKNSIRAELIRRNVSLKDLSIVIKKNYTTTAKKINGSGTLTAEELGLIAKHLDVDINLFYNK